MCNKHKLQRSVCACILACVGISVCGEGGGGVKGGWGHRQCLWWGCTSVHYVHSCVCVCARARVCQRACVRLCVCVCVRERERESTDVG